MTESARKGLETRRRNEERRREKAAIYEADRAAVKAALLRVVRNPDASPEAVIEACRVLESSYLKRW